MALGQVIEAPASSPPDTPEMHPSQHQSAGASYAAFGPQTPSRPRVYPAAASLLVCERRLPIASSPDWSHQKEEVCAFDNIEVCHDHEPRWSVDCEKDLLDF